MARTGGMLPTPRASDPLHAIDKPASPSVLKHAAQGFASLAELARIGGYLPTPTSTDYKSDGPGNHRRVTVPLRSFAALGLLPHGEGTQTARGGPLSARFVEWMMGFQIDWTMVTPPHQSGSTSTRRG